MGGNPSIQFSVLVAYTVSTLYTLAGRFANRLRRYGFQSQDVIANTLTNCPERVVTDLGIILAGCVTFCTEVQQKDSSVFNDIALRSQCRCIIMSDNDQSPAWNLFHPYISGNNSKFIADLSINKFHKLNTALVVSRNHIGSKKPFLEDLLTSEEDVFVSDSSPSDVAVVFTTSGSSGLSKLVHKTHQEMVTIVRNNEVIVFKDPDCPDKRYLQYSDRLLGWGGGFAPLNILALLPRVLRDNFFYDTATEASDFWEAVAKENCTCSVMLPIEVHQLLEYAERNQLSPRHPLQYVMLTAQPITKMTVEKTYEIADKVFVGYGSTECFDVSQVFADEESYESFNCGKPFDGVTVRVVNGNNEICQPMERGTIHVKGLFRGYFNRHEDPDPNTLKAMTPDGWFDMEDYGYLDDEGNLYVLGRNKDIITYGCEVVYPAWVEEKIMQHPDVVQACLVPVSDPVIHQNICACLKLTSESKANADDLQSFCQNMFFRNGFGIVPAFFMLFKDDFPELQNGKPDKVKLKMMAEVKYGYKGINHS